MWRAKTLKTQPDSPAILFESFTFSARAGTTRDEDLDAALNLFANHSFASTTVEQIATLAGLLKGAVYLYFPSKKALLEALVKRAVSPLADQALQSAAHQTGDPRPLLRQATQKLLEGMAHSYNFVVPKIVIREAVNAPEIAQMYRREVLDKALPALTALIEQGMRGGYIRQLDPELTVRSVLGPLIMHVLMAEVFDISPAGGLQLDRLIDNHLDILFAGLEPVTETEK